MGSRQHRPVRGRSEQCHTRRHFRGWRERRVASDLPGKHRPLPPRHSAERVSRDDALDDARSIPRNGRCMGDRGRVHDPQQVLACMRSKTHNQVLTAIPVGTLQVVAPPNRVYWEPVVDGNVIRINRAPVSSRVLSSASQLLSGSIATRDGAPLRPSSSLRASPRREPHAVPRLGDGRVRAARVAHSRGVSGGGFQRSGRGHGAARGGCAIRLRGA